VGEDKHSKYCNAIRHRSKKQKKKEIKKGMWTSPKEGASEKTTPTPRRYLNQNPLIKSDLYVHSEIN